MADRVRSLVLDTSKSDTAGYYKSIAVCKFQWLWLCWYSKYFFILKLELQLLKVRLEFWVRRAGSNYQRADGNFRSQMGFLMPSLQNLKLVAAPEALDKL